MDDMHAFEQRTNETRQRIGKPPVARYELPDVYPWQRLSFMRATHYDAMFAASMVLLRVIGPIGRLP